MAEPAFEALWKSVLDHWDEDRTHRAFLDYCGATDQLAEAAARYRGMKGDRDRCLASGMDAYVTKPIRSKELCRAIQETTHSSPITASVSSQAAVTPVTATDSHAWQTQLERLHDTCARAFNTLERATA